MMLIDREDVERLGLDPFPFYLRREVGSPEAIAHADDPDVMADGPFLLIVNDEMAWAGQSEDRLMLVANKKADGAALRRWQGLADLYVAGTGFSRVSLVMRIRSVGRALRAAGGWCPWDHVYHWPEGSERVWSGLYHHPIIETRVEAGKKEARAR